MTDIADPRAVQASRSTTGALASLSLAMLLSSLSTSIANVALPTLSTAFAASFPAGKVEAAITQRVTTPEYMCQGCDWSRSLMVILSRPA